MPEFGADLFFKLSPPPSLLSSPLLLLYLPVLLPLCSCLFEIKIYHVAQSSLEFAILPPLSVRVRVRDLHTSCGNLIIIFIMFFCVLFIENVVSSSILAF